MDIIKSLGKGMISKWYILVLLLIVLLAFWFRSFPARFNELQALDPLYIYRAGETALNNNLQLPAVDTMRGYPFGSPGWDYPVAIYLPVFSYLFISSIGIKMLFFNFALIYPAIMGALAVIVMFFIGKELFDWKAGLFSAFFLATIPAFITRTSAGFFDKEPTTGFFMLLSILFFITCFKRNSWKHGILSGIFLAVMALSSSMAQYIFIFYSVFLLILLLLNRYHERIIKLSLPIFVFAILLTQLSPTHISITNAASLIFIGIFVISILRNSVERFNLIKKEQLQYFVPGLIIIAFVGLLFSSMVSDFAYNNLQIIGDIITVRMASPVGYTVAEQQSGSFSTILQTSGTQASAGLLPFLAPITPYFAIWIFMLLGMLLMIYKLYRWKKLFLLFPLLWVISGIWSVHYFVRLIFLFGPPAALLAGYFICWLINRASKLKIMERAQTFKEKINYISIPLSIFIALLVTINLASAYVYSASMGPSICFPDSRYLIDGEKCLEIDENGNYIFAQGQPWYEAMTFLREETPEDSNVISWWDFGYWFQTRGERNTVADGGYGNRQHLAEWFTANAEDWSNYDWYLKDKFGVDYILMDYTLPGKYGAISAIASGGEQIIGILQFSPSGTYPEENKTIYEYSNGPYALWIPIQDGNLTGTPMLLVLQNGQYMSRSYINDVCTSNGIIHFEEKGSSVGGCVALSSLGVFYVPEPAEHTIFTNLMFMDGYDLPLEKVFDNQLIRIYKVMY